MAVEQFQKSTNFFKVMKNRSIGVKFIVWLNFRKKRRALWRIAGFAERDCLYFIETLFAGNAGLNFSLNLRK